MYTDNLNALNGRKSCESVIHRRNQSFQQPFRCSDVFVIFVFGICICHNLLLIWYLYLIFVFGIGICICDNLYLIFVFGIGICICDNLYMIFAYDT